MISKEAVEELMRLSEEHGGSLQPADVVEAAKDPASPLHRYFTWDVQEAAEKCWELEARWLLRHAKIEITVREETIPIRAFVAIEDDAGQRRYLATEAVIASDVLLDRHLANCQREAEAFIRRNEHLVKIRREDRKKALQAVRKAIQSLQRMIQAIEMAPV